MAAARRATALSKAAYHCGAFPEIPSITAEELVRRRDDGSGDVIVVDVRTAAERRVSSINGSVSRQDFEASLARHADQYKNATVVTFCTVGRRSGAYAATLARRRCCGRVLNSEGIVAYSWCAAATGDHALVDADGAPAARIHVYASPWDYASPRFESVRFGLAGAVLAMFRD